MKRSIAVSVAVIAALALVGLVVVRADDDDDDDAKDQQALARAMPAAKVPLERGVAAAAASQGSPISAKFEVEDGTFQLSVYTRKGVGFVEVIVDHLTGSVAKAEAITSGEDLAAAKAQQQAMAAATRPLAAAIEEAVRQNPGYRAVSAMPRLDGGRPVAQIALLKGSDWKAVQVSLSAGG